MTAKEKAIQEAFGEAWEKVKEHVDEQGGLYASKFTPESCGFTGETDFYKWNYWKPKSLRYLNSNHGWTRLDERPPSVRGDYYVCVDGKFDGDIMHSHEIQLPGNPMNVSHWRPIDPVKPPIY